LGLVNIIILYFENNIIRTGIIFRIKIKVILYFNTKINKSRIRNWLLKLNFRLKAVLSLLRIEVKVSVGNLEMCIYF